MVSRVKELQQLTRGEFPPETIRDYDVKDNHTDDNAFVSTCHGKEFVPGGLECYGRMPDYCGVPSLCRGSLLAVSLFHVFFFV